MSFSYNAKVLLKRGSGDPSTSLDIGEAGYDTSSGKLYIGNGLGNPAIGITMDPSYNSLYNYVQSLDASVNSGVSKVYVDGSLNAKVDKILFDSSIFSIWNYEFIQDSSLSFLNLRINLSDSSLLILTQRHNLTEVSLGSLTMKVSGIESSLGFYATNSSVGIAIAPFATNASVGLALNPYTTNASVGTALAQFIRNSSNGYGLYWKNGYLDVSLATQGATIEYVDGSLFTRDLSISNLYSVKSDTSFVNSQLGLRDVSISWLNTNKTSFSYVDGSLARRDASITDLYNTKVNRSGDTMTGTLNINASLNIRNDVSINGSLRVGNDSSLGSNLPYVQIDASNGNKIVSSNNYYGQEFFYEVSSGITTTTSTTPNTYIRQRMTFGPVTGGMYKISNYYNFSMLANNQNFFSNVLIDDASIGTHNQERVNVATTDQIDKFRTFYVRLSPGIHSVSQSVWVGGSTATIRESSLEVIKVSQ